MDDPKGNVDIENPGAENNEAVPVDERQAQQIGDMLAPPQEVEVEEPLEELGGREEEGREFYDPTKPREEPEEEYDASEEYEEEEDFEQPELEAEEEEEDEVPQPADEVSQLKEQLAEMRGIVQTLQGQLKGEDAQEEPEPDLPKIEVDPDEFLTDEELDEFSIDPAAVLKKALARVYTKAREDTLRDMPGVVTKATQRQTAVQQAQNAFWSENKDLLEKANNNPAVAKFIRTTANEIQAENPSWDISQIFTETGKQVRKAIGAAKKAKKTENKAGKKPNHPGKPSSKRRGKDTNDNRSPEQRQIDDMVASVQ